MQGGSLDGLLLRSPAGADDDVAVTAGQSNSCCGVLWVPGRATSGPGGPST